MQSNKSCLILFFHPGHVYLLIHNEADNYDQTVAHRVWSDGRNIKTVAQEVSERITSIHLWFLGYTENIHMLPYCTSLDGLPALYQNLNY